MNLNKGGSMNDIQAMDAQPVLNRQDQSLASVNLSRNNTINSIQPQDQYFEVVEKKQQGFSNQADFIKLLNQFKKPQIIDTHKVSFKKKPSNKKQQQLAKPVKHEQTKKEKILKIIEPHMKNYKTLNNPNSSDTEVTKFRAECRQKIFKFLMYGIEQLKLLKQQQLNQQERRVTKLQSKDPYLLVKALTTQIDIEFLRNLNNDNKQVVNKKYRSILKGLTTYLADQSNIDLRRKILSKTYNGKKLATMKEEEFYPPHVREKIIERQNLLLRQAAAQEKPVVVMNDDIEYQNQPVEAPVVQKIEEQEKKPKYKYIEQSSLLMLRDLLKAEQIIKMKGLLQFGSRIDIQEKLVGNLTKVFDSLL